jgi:alkylation response protein AidB-like acyl-CoA dehydrogenase
MAIFVETERDRQVRDEVLQFRREEVEPRIATMERGQVDYELPRLMARMGWSSPSYGPEYRGLGTGQRWKAIMLATLAEKSPAAAMIAQAPIIPAEAIVHFGTEQQKRQYLEAIATGDCMPSIAATEPECGGDLLEIETTARPVADGEYELIGVKDTIGNARVADVHLVIARTGPRELRTQALSAFIVEAGRDGVTAEPHVPLMGLRGFSCDQITLDRCRVPAANLIGEEGDGWLIAVAASLLAGRTNIGAVALGITQAACDAADAFGQNQRLRRHQTNHQRIGEIRKLRNVSWMALEKAVNRRDAGLPCDEDLNVAKLAAVEAALASTQTARAVGGASTLKVGGDLERLVRDAVCLDPPAGPAIFQRYRLFQLHNSPHQQISERFPSPLATR